MARNDAFYTDLQIPWRELKKGGPPEPFPSHLKVESHLRGQSARCNVMRSAKGRKEVIKRIFVSDVDGRQPQAHLVFITFKYVVVTDGHIEKTA